MRSDTEKGVQMLKRTEEISGTSLRGEIVATRAELTAVLGEPIHYEEGGKVTLEWGIRLGSTVATVYDWKRYEEGTPTDHEEITYHIGGHDEKAVLLVQTLLDLGRKVAN
jgi:hypothetical protein